VLLYTDTDHTLTHTQTVLYYCSMESLLQQLSSQLNRVDELCVPSEQRSEDLTSLLKSLYDVSASASSKPIGPLASLHTDSVDADTIWEELQSKNRPLKRMIKSKSNKLLAKLVYAADASSDEEQEQEQGDEDSVSSSSLQAVDEDDMSLDESEEAEDDVSDAEAEGEEEDSNEEEVGGGEDDADDAEHEQMEHWLDAFEEMEDQHKRRLEKGGKGKGGHKGAVENEEEDDFDYVSSALYALDDDEEEEGSEGGDSDDGETGHGAMASDFFGSEKPSKPKSKSSATPGKQSKAKGKSAVKPVAKKAVKGTREAAFADDDSEDEEYYGQGGDGVEAASDSEEDGDDWDENGHDDFDDMEGDHDEEEEEEEEEEAILSKHQQRQRKIAETVSELEAAAIGEKSWDMKVSKLISKLMTLMGGGTLFILVFNMT
jgi:U3 small nucleolar RNA-associated protein MPP10